ncbi:MAG: hypothetical protein AAFX05_04215, partial [Planctomycetota bacterium]
TTGPGPNANDNLVAVGTPGGADFRLVTIDPSGIALSQYANFTTTTGMSYIGWAGDHTLDLRSDIEGPGGSYSPTGVVGPPLIFDAISDPRFPDAPAFGPDDIETAIAFDLNPNATSATVSFFMEASVIPAPSVGTVGLLTLGGLTLRCRRA